MKKLFVVLTVITVIIGAFIGWEWYKAYQYKHRFDGYNLEELSKYKDFIGIIQIDGVLSEPVVQGDNAFYLTHDIDGSENKNGCVFADSLYNDTADNFVLYGHNSRNGTVFSNLVKYKDEDFAGKNSHISFLWKDGTVSEYKLVLVYNYNTNDADKRHPYLPDYPDDYNSRFSSYPTYWKDGDVEGNIITLSTCEESVYGQAGRIVLVGVKNG